jgi:regulator of protease activity HflC (stomatin/prohibitin superfamily)
VLLTALVVVLVIVAVLAAVLLGFSLRTIRAYERGVVTRFGKPAGERGPGLVLVMPFIDRVHRVTMQTVALELEPQDVISEDHVSLTIRAVVYLRVTDATTSYVAVENYEDAIDLYAQSTMRRVIGAHPLADILSHSEAVSRAIAAALETMAGQWGITVTDIQLNDISMPVSMQRAMASAAEAQREAAAKVAAAQGERDSAELLEQAASLMSPTALRLRELQTIREVGTERSTIIVMDSSKGDLAGQAAAGTAAALARRTSAAPKP